MRVHVVSDVHGRHEALREAADGADALLCLGDLLLFLDYADHGQGIFPELFGAEAAGQFIALRTAQRFDEARAMSARLWSRLDGDPVARLEEVVSRQYEELFAALQIIALRTAQRFDEARAMSARLWSRLDGDPVARLEEVVSRQYEELFAAL